MVIQKTALYKVLAIVLVLVLLVGSSERVEAAELSNKVYERGLFFYDSDKNLERIQWNFFSYDSDDNSKIYCLLNTGGQDEKFTKSYVLYSFEPINVRVNIIQRDDYSNGNSVISTDSTIEILASNADKYYLSNGETIYVYYKQYEQYPEPNDVITRIDYVDYYHFHDLRYDDYSIIFERIYVQGVDPDIPGEVPFKPNWAAVGDDPLLYIKNLQAEIVDEIIEIVWEPQPDVPYKYLDNVYINFLYNSKSPGTIQSLVSRRKYKETGKYANMKDLSISIPLSDLDIPEGDIITSLHAQPFFYINDDTNNDTKKGQASIIYFDENGLSSSPIIVSPDVQDEMPIENVEQNIFTSIQNFFGNFWRNITTTIKSAVVPDSGDVLALLQEMNDWFSVRFGFIWYPFDLAIDIMAAFALGEPDSKITVPALTLNMFGGVKIWDEFQADLDPIDFLKYVRFFTSTIMCCGTVSLAIRKWDEWIGGRSS